MRESYLARVERVSYKSEILDIIPELSLTHEQAEEKIKNVLKQGKVPIIFSNHVLGDPQLKLTLPFWLLPGLHVHVTNLDELAEAKIPALGGKASKNNKVILEHIALNGPKLPYDVLKGLKYDLDQYSTVNRRIRDLKKNRYLAEAGKRASRSQVPGRFPQGPVGDREAGHLEHPIP